MPSVPTPGGNARLAGHEVARIGFGTMQLEKPAVASPADRERAASVLRRAVELGVNHLDTAEFYGDDVCNALIRETLSPYADGLVIATKVGAVRVEGGRLVPAQKPHELRASVEANLSTLGAERLGVVNLRRADAPPGIRSEGGQIVDLDDQLAELIALRDEGKIDGIGLSNVDVAQLTAALPAGIACVQNAYNLLSRGDEPILEVCRANEIDWVPFFPLGSGFPGQKRVTESPIVIQLASELGATPAQIGLAWLLTSYAGTLLIPGTSSLEHLEENLAAGDVRLDSAAMARLDAATAA